MARKKVNEVKDNALQLITPEQQQELDMINNLPDLGAATALPLDMMSDYWTPQNVGEKKRVFFKELAVRDVLDSDSGEVYQLPCVFFLEKVDGILKTVCNGSKRLLGAFEGDHIKQFTPFEITYLGKVNNSTNSYKSDSWSVKPLVISQ